MGAEREDTSGVWVTVERPGYFGKKRAEFEERWNKEYGEGNWQIVLETPQGKILSFDGLMEVYIEGYAEYFRKHPEEVRYVTENFSYCYDKEMVTKEEAFDPYARFEKPGHVNQFHNVAMNIALEKVLGMPFKGKEPLKVRAAKPGTSESEWPAGWKWQPGLIPCVHPEEIFDMNFEGQWWEKGSIEDFYQCNKALQILGIKNIPGEKK